MLDLTPSGEWLVEAKLCDGCGGVAVTVLAGVRMSEAARLASKRASDDKVCRAGSEGRLLSSKR